MIIEKRTPKTIEYFIKLNQYVADRVHRLGEERVISELGDKRMYCGGLRFCMGELNSPYQVYEYRYSSKTKELEESRPEEQSRTISTLEASLKRPVYGGRAKLLESPEEVRSPLGDVADSTPIIGNPNLYERYMSTSLSGEKAEFTAISNIKRNIDGINKDKESPITAAKTELPILIHVKEQLFRFPQATVTSLALHYGIKEKNTIARINLLRDMGVFSVAFAERLKNSVEFLLKFRLQAQTAHREEFEYVSTGTWEEFSNHCEKIKATLSKIEREEAESGSTFGKEVEICNKKIRDLELQLSELEGKQGKEPEREKLKTHHEYQKQRFEELIDKDGLKEFCKDFLGAYSAKIEKNQYPDRVGTHPPALSAFSALDKAALEETVLPTLRDLFEMAKKSLSGGGFNPTPFSTK
jgi:hypothetical protein